MAIIVQNCIGIAELTTASDKANFVNSGQHIQLQYLTTV